MSLIRELHTKITERGVAITEFAISLPFLALLTYAVVDLGNYLRQYTQIHEAIHQGVRMGSAFSLLPSGPVYSSSGRIDGFGCAANFIPNGRDSLHWDVQERVRKLVDIQHLALDPESICIRSQRDAGVRDLLVVQLDARYVGFSPLFNHVPISVQARAPHL